jgi:hypothetical protein
MLTPSISEANQNPGSQTGEPAEADTRRRRATSREGKFS